MTVAANLKVGISAKDPKSPVLAFLPSLTLFVPAPAERENTHRTGLEFVVIVLRYLHAQRHARSHWQPLGS
jgi:hypothetical protein